MRVTDVNEQQPNERNRRQSKDETRRELLAAAHEMLLEEGLPPGINLKLTEVLKQKGLTTGAAYHIWDSQRSFQEDLMTHIAEEFDFAQTTLATEAKTHRGAVEEVAAQVSEDLDEAARSYAIDYFERFRHRPEFYLALQLWGIKEPSAKVTAAVCNGYDSIHRDFVEMFELSLAVAGRRMRAPFTIDEATVAITALTEGLALRQRFNPSITQTESGEHLYAEGVMAMIDYFTEEIPTPQADE